MTRTTGFEVAVGAARLLLIVALCAPAAADAFVTLRPQTTDLESAVRWAAAPNPVVANAGLYDGIQVATEPGLAEKLALAVTGVTDEADVADIEAALRAAFAAWESSVLRFEVEFDGPAERGSGGREIDVFAVPESDPVFQDNDFFGRTDSTFFFVDDRRLTDGTVLPGFAFVAADIFLNLDMLADISGVFSREQQPAALQRLVMHETGHALGFGHPNVFPEFNYDTDFDPLNAMVIDPTDPLGDLMLSPNVNVDAVMSNLPTMFPALLLTALTNDELGGRDALYPAAPVSACPADCDSNGAVTIDELVRVVDIGSGRSYFLDCPTADRDHNLTVTIDEIVLAVHAALFGCSDASELVVDVDWLVARLQDPQVQIVDTRPAFPGGHIPGALPLSPNLLATTRDGVNAQVVGAEQGAAALASVGLRQRSIAVVYGDAPEYDPARVVWALKYLGHDVRYLDGGWGTWMAAGAPIAAGPPSPEGPSEYDVEPVRDDIRVTGDWVLDRLGDPPYESPTIQIVDARSTGEFEAGHIPTALHVQWTRNLQDGFLRPPAELDELYVGLGLDPSRTTVVYCLVGWRASVAWLTLTWLGFEDVRVYDGSWLEWGSGDFPIEGGTQVGT